MKTRAFAIFSPEIRAFPFKKWPFPYKSTLKQLKKGVYTNLTLSVFILPYRDPTQNSLFQYPNTKRGLLSGLQITGPNFDRLGV